MKGWGWGAAGWGGGEGCGWAAHLAHACSVNWRTCAHSDAVGGGVAVQAGRKRCQVHIGRQRHAAAGAAQHLLALLPAIHVDVEAGGG